MQQPLRCPLCSAETDRARARAGAACSRCGYHADSYNRAQDDVALSFRLALSDPSRTRSTATPTTTGTTWLSAIPAWCKAHWPPNVR